MTDANRPVRWGAALSLCTQAGKAPLLAIAGLAAAQAVLPVAGLLAMMQLVDAVADGISGRLATEDAWDAALFATAVAALVALLGGVLRSLASVLNENHGRKLADVGVQSLQEQTAKLELAEFDKPGFHDAMQRAGQEAGQGGVGRRVGRD